MQEATGAIRWWKGVVWEDWACKRREEGRAAEEVDRAKPAPWSWEREDGKWKMGEAVLNQRIRAQCRAFFSD